MKPRRKLKPRRTLETPETSTRSPIHTGKLWWLAALFCAILLILLTRTISTISDLQESVAWHEQQASWKADAGEKALAQTRIALRNNSPRYGSLRNQVESHTIEADVYLKFKKEKEVALAAFPPPSLIWSLIILAGLFFIFSLLKSLTAETLERIRQSK